MRTDADNIRSHSIIFLIKESWGEPDEACILLGFDKPHQLFTVKADILTWKQQIKSRSPCWRQQSLSVGELLVREEARVAHGSGTGTFNSIIIGKQNRTKGSILALNSRWADCSKYCPLGCSVVWVAGLDVEGCAVVTSLLDLKETQTHKHTQKHTERSVTHCQEWQVSYWASPLKSH